MSDGYRGTKWGTACVYLWQEMISPSTDTEASPSRLALSVGPDEAAQTQAPPVITFLHDEETPRVPFRGGGRAGGHAWDRDVRINVELWGESPAQAEALEEQLLIALDTIAHGRAGKPGKFRVLGSESAGNDGMKVVGQITIIPSYVSRPSGAPPLGVVRDIPRTAVPTSHGVTIVVDAPGEAPGRGEAVAIDT